MQNARHRCDEPSHLCFLLFEGDSQIEDYGACAKFRGRGCERVGPHEYAVRVELESIAFRDGLKRKS
jgi:hypothetical protein